MLRVADPLDGPSEPAYAVPWALDRRRAPRFILRNISAERLSGITLAVLGPGTVLWGIPTALLPGELVGFTLRADEPELATVVVVRWSRPNGEEYLWRMSF